ncbi:flagellar hook-basal body protein [Aquibacillus sp. 3ASR75-11]|uniref:Flagellar hook-basal body protein n=1 Tax=Terrihalobacillus insolitus TaxID=2950438 RepID=A0A9X3WT50_9BACI|nr:flagellar hook-basal body protein [Terrihalobacillus insolitus]MDC3425010.1 flagellar hook-basal body protein [Terrihalobacillus insolitus]
MGQMTIQAAVTMGQLQKKMDVIANNMANVDTAGYKNRQADFASLLFQQIDNLSDPQNAEGRLTPDGIRIGSGAALAQTNMNLSQGAIKDTGRNLDVALLDKNNFFAINVTENGNTETRYTRDGAFYLNPLNDGQVMLTTKNGNPVVGINGPLVFADGFEAINITENGQIAITRNGDQQIEGQLAVAEAVRPRLLEATGENMFKLPNLVGLNYNADEIVETTDLENIRVKSGALESSNVDTAKQMTDLLETQRAYQMNGRSISMADQMMGLVNQLR